MRVPTGDQYALKLETENGTVSATITQVAASLRELSVRGVELVEPYAVSIPAPGAAGIVLAPWPNRIEDGKWSYTAADGTVTEEQLSLTEPALHNAIHGLLRYMPYELIARDESSVTLGATIFPQLGWPFTLDTQVSYQLDEDGLTVVHTFTNVGDAAAPVAVGAHPYFKLGRVPTSELQLTVHADTHFEVDDRLNIVAEHPVDGTEYDLRTPHRVGDLTLDDGFGQAGPGVLASLADGEGRTLELWGTGSVRYLQVFTHRHFPGLAEGELALALEPQTAPANSLTSGVALRWLEPGAQWQVRWGMRAIGF